MTIEEQLKQKILERYKSVRAFTTSINIPYSTLDSVFKRGIANAGVSTMIKVFDALDLDLESIQSVELRNRTHKNSPSTAEAAPGEEQLISLYRELNDEGMEKLVDYADDLVSSGKYIKKVVRINWAGKNWRKNKSRL